MKTMLELYHAGLTQASVKVRLTLKEKGLAYKSHLLNIPDGEHLTPQYLADYKRGWNLWGLRAFLDHPEVSLQPIVQMSGDWQEQHTEACEGAAGAHFLAADEERDLSALARHALQRFLEVRALRAARSVGEHGLIEGSRDADIGFDHRAPPIASRAEHNAPCP